MFQLRQVSRSFQKDVALHPMDLDLPSGQTTALIGPSGCGKSTLLRLLVGLLEPSSGQITFQGAPVVASDSMELRQRMGYVIQGGGLFPHLTALGNVALLARHLRWPEERIAARAEELRRVVSIDEALWTRYPLEMSGGQQQRVALMRALMLDPDVLLLDEPLGALDPIVRADLQRDLRDTFRRLGKTVVIVTHDLGEARYLADRIVLLQRGRIIQEGTFEDLVERPSDPFVEQFVGAQRMTSL